EGRQSADREGGEPLRDGRRRSGPAPAGETEDNQARSATDAAAEGRQSADREGGEPLRDGRRRSGPAPAGETEDTLNPESVPQLASGQTGQWVSEMMTVELRLEAAGAATASIRILGVPAALAALGRSR
ncbi:hypothetical protein ABIB75_007815, partial [Bradyrhizobium sp. GM2.2]|uniref:hypothetical protein n=1 Tax=Bradyrhizobium sp. GM2.2 TaxID=3156358 RepID=UPI00339323F3